MMDLDIVLKDVLSKKLQITTALDIIKERLAYLEGQLRQISPFELQHNEPSIDPIIEEEPEEIRPILYTIQKLSKALHQPPSLRDYAVSQTSFIEEIREAVSIEFNNASSVFQKVARNSDIGKLKFNGTLKELCLWLEEVQKEGKLEIPPARTAIISCFLINNRDISPESYSATKSRLKNASDEEKKRQERSKHRNKLLGKSTNQSSPGS